MKKYIIVFFSIICMVSVCGFSEVLNWSQVSGDGLGDYYNIELFPGGVYNGYMYVFSERAYTEGYPQVYRTSDGTTLETVTNTGFGETNSIGLVPGYVQYGGYQYAYSVNQNDGLQVWRSQNGDHGTWSTVNTPGFGDLYNSFIGGSVVHNGYLYVGTYNGNYEGAGCEIWYFNGETWTRDATGSSSFGCCGNYIAFPQVSYNGYLYCGTNHSDCSPTQAGGLWRSASPWTAITVDGFGDIHNEGIFPANKGFNGYLYAGTENSSTGCEIWRSVDGAPGTWTQVNTDGFGDSNNIAVYSFSIPGDGHLYVATDNGITGTEVWRTNGTTWEQVNTDGFGVAANSAAFLARELFKNYLFAGTCNSSGAHIWKVNVNQFTIETTSVTSSSPVGERGSIAVIGSEERKGVVNPDKGDSVVVSFKGNCPGKYTCRIFTLLGEIIYEESIDSISEGQFSWVPEGIASGVYVVYVKGPGVDIHKKVAILR